MRSYESLAANIVAVEKLGRWIHMSGMFGTGNESQGLIIASELFITNQPLMDYQKRNDIVSGRPSKPYDAMIAEFQEAGGKIKVIEKSPDAARIELTYEGNTTPFAFSWDEAKKEPLPYQTSRDLPEAKVIEMLSKGEQPPLKAKYATPRSRAIMLYARCVSDAIRTVASKCNFGTYTPEEIEDFTELQPVAGAAPSAVANALAPPAAVPTTIPAESLTGPYRQQDRAAAVELPPGAPAPAIQETIPIDPARVIRTDGPAQQHQKDAIIQAMGVLVQQGVTDIRDRVVNKLKTSGIEGGILGLTAAEADALLAALHQKQTEAWLESELKGHAKKA